MLNFLLSEVISPLGAHDVKRLEINSFEVSAQGIQ